MITDRSLRSTKIGPGKVRWIHLLRSKEAGAVWIRMLSHRFGLLTDPLGVTGFMCGPLCGPYWLHHSIQFSRFRRSEAIRYWSCTPLSITTCNRFPVSIPCRMGMKNAPDSEASDGRATAIRWPRSVIRLTSPTYDFSRSRSTQSQKRLGYSITAPARTQETRADSVKVLSPAPRRRNQEAVATPLRARGRSDACRPGAPGPQPHSMRHRTSRERRVHRRCAVRRRR